METKGFYIQAIRDALMNTTLDSSDKMVDIFNIEAEKWYSGEMEIELTNIIEEKLGRLTLIRIGRNVIKRNSEQIMKTGYASIYDYFKELNPRYPDPNYL